MGMLTHVSVNIFPIVMLLIIYGNNQKKATKGRDKQEFNMLVLAAMGLMIVDTLSGGAEGIGWKGVDIWLWIFYVIHAMLVVGVAWTWFVYVCDRLKIRFCRQEMSGEQKREGYYLLGCGILPLIGVVIHHFWSDWWLGVPLLSLSILFIYLNTQNRQITTDVLTGLSNRREFDQYIVKKTEQTRGNNWGMLMLDVDDFKMINDTLGHVVGDEALWETADILRRILGSEKTFLARYGGDEFAVIGDWNDEQEAGTAIAKIHEEVSRFNEEAGKKYQLSLSIGYAMWTEVQTLEQIVEIADERMYEVKMRKKAK